MNIPFAHLNKIGHIDIVLDVSSFSSTSYSTGSRLLLEFIPHFRRWSKYNLNNIYCVCVCFFVSQIPQYVMVVSREMVFLSSFLTAQLPQIAPLSHLECSASWTDRESEMIFNYCFS
jgi:hypothetical protein